MGTGEQELKLKASVEGAKEAARDIGEVGKATEQVGKQAGTAAQPIKDQTEEQKKLNAAGSDYIGILSQIHPSLGAFAGAMLNAVKVSGDLANKQLDLKGMLTAATEAAKGNAGALKLIGAGGAVVIGIMAIVAALAKMKEEAQRVKAALQEMAAELNALEGKRIETKADLERRSAARAEGPYDVVESDKAMQAYERLGSRAPYLEDESRRQAVLVGGVDATLARLEQIAVLFESPGKAWHGADDLLGRDAGSRASALEMQLEHFAEQIDTTIKREREQAPINAARAVAESRTEPGMGTTSHLVEFIRNLPGGSFEGMNPEALAEAVQAMSGLEDWYHDVGRTGNRRMDALQDSFSNPAQQLMDLGARLRDDKGLSDKASEPGYLRAAEMILQRLDRTAAKLTEFTDNLDGKLEVGATHNHTHNDKYVLAPGSASTVGKGRLQVAGD